MKGQVEKIKAIVKDKLIEHEVKRAAFFGSIVRNEMTPESDIDILIEFAGSKSLLDLAGLKLDIQELLGKAVNVITYNSLHPLLKDRILEEQILIYNNGC